MILRVYLTACGSTWYLLTGYECRRNMIWARGLFVNCVLFAIVCIGRGQADCISTGSSVLWWLAMRKNGPLVGTFSFALTASAPKSAATVLTRYGQKRLKLIPPARFWSRSRARTPLSLPFPLSRNMPVVPHRG